MTSENNSPAFTVLVCGDRDWSNEPAMRKVFARFPEGTLIIHGGCRGADRMAGVLSGEFGFKCQVFPADWDLHGRSAGPRRNADMIKQEPDLVVAFHPDLNKSRGSADTLARAKKKKIPVDIVIGQ